MLEEQHVDVPSSLKDLLCQLRLWCFPEYGLQEESNSVGCRIMREAGTRLFWADAICINQADIQEKATQIPRMNSIYSSAVEVFAWLGTIQEDWPEELSSTPPRNMSRPAFIREVFDQANSLESLEKTGDLDELIHNKSLDRVTPTGELEELIRNKTLDQYLPVSDDIFAEAFEQCILQGTELFFRTWITQELILARNPAVLVMGSNCTRLSLLNALYLYIRNSVKSKTLWFSLRGFKNFDLYRNIQHWYRARTHLVDIDDYNDTRVFASDLNWVLKHLANQAYATLAQDFVYGVFGLVRLPKDSLFGVPDYSLLPAAVFQRYCRLIFEQTGDLSLLDTVTAFFKGLPSWVPDLVFGSGNHADHEPPVRASVSFSDDGSKMTVAGTILSKVVLGFSPMRRESYEMRERFGEVLLEDVERFADQFLSKAAQLFAEVDLEKALEQWLDTLAKVIFNAEELSDFKHYFLRLLDKDDREVPDASFQSLSLTAMDPRPVTLFALIDQNACFFTGDGACHSMRRQQVDPIAGDLLAVLRGLDATCLLRPLEKDHEYEFLTCCQSPCLADIEADEAFFQARDVVNITLV